MKMKIKIKTNTYDKIKLAHSEAYTQNNKTI